MQSVKYMRIPELFFPWIREEIQKGYFYWIRIEISPLHSVSVEMTISCHPCPVKCCHRQPIGDGFKGATEVERSLFQTVSEISPLHQALYDSARFRSKWQNISPLS